LAGYALAPVMMGLKGAFALASMLFHRLEMRNKYTKKSYPKNYIAVVKKRAGASQGQLLATVDASIR
jgi:hypothetical protein